MALPPELVRRHDRATYTFAQAITYRSELVAWVLDAPSIGEFETRKADAERKLRDVAGNVTGVPTGVDIIRALNVPHSSVYTQTAGAGQSSSDAIAVMLARGNQAAANLSVPLDQRIENATGVNVLEVRPDGTVVLAQPADPSTIRAIAGFPGVNTVTVTPEGRPQTSPSAATGPAPTTASGALPDVTAGGGPTVATPSATVSGGTPPTPGAVQVPGGSELWLVDGIHFYLRYLVPGTQIPMLWHIEDTAQLAGIFPGGTPNPDRRLTTAELQQAGSLLFGGSKELANTSEHPFDQFTATFTQEAAIRPWLRDPEVLALTAQAILEGRTVTEAELKTTEWWTTRTEAERAWITLNAQDPATARSMIDDRRVQVANALQQLGITGLPSTIHDYIARRWSTGEWSETFALQQMQELANPAQPGALDPELEELTAGSPDLFRAADDATQARQMVTQWLGSFHAGAWSEDQLREWGRKIRLGEAEKAQFEDVLRKQRQALFPEYDNPDLTYEDIAAPWRAVAQRAWGQTIDEDEPFFVELVRMNNVTEAERRLREEGLRRNIGPVIDRALNDLGEGAGAGQVLNPISRS